MIITKKEIELEEEINLLEKEVKVLGEDAEKGRLDLEEAVDCLRLEIESLKGTLKGLLPAFQDTFDSIQSTVLREIDPLRLDKK